MKTKKIVCLICAIAVICTIATAAFAGCNTPMDAQTAYDEFMAALDLSLSGDMYGPAYDPEKSVTNGYIFAYKESVRGTDMITNTNVNVHCDQDASYNLHVDEDLMVDLYQETYGVNSVTGGAGSKIGDFGFIVGPYPDADSTAERMYYTERASDKSGAYVNTSLWGDMSAEDFVATDFFRKYSLSSRLEELRNMPFDAFVFDKDVNSDFGAYRQINLVKITFGVTQEYIDNYKATTGKTSIFDGCTYAEIELTFGRFSNIYVYQTESLDGGSFFDLPQEKYSLQVTYLGKNVAFPSGHDSDYTKDENLLERTDLAFARATF